MRQSNFLGNVYEGPIALILVKCVREDLTVVDDPKIQVPIVIVVEPSPLKGVLQSISHTSNIRHIGELP